MTYVCFPKISKLICITGIHGKQVGIIKTSPCMDSSLVLVYFQQSEDAYFPVSEFVCVMELLMLPQQPVLNCCNGNKSIDV